MADGELTFIATALHRPKIIKVSIDMAPSTGSPSSAQNAAHSCERVPFLALPGLVGP